MKYLSRLALYLLILLVTALLVQTSYAQEDAITDDDVNEIAKGLYCPVCESTPLDVCGTQACADWRALIREKLSEGESKEEIIEYFAQQYGDGVLADPPRRGVSLIVLWILPVVLVLAALFFFGRYVQNLRAASAPVTAVLDDEQITALSSTPPAHPPTGDYVARVEEELQK